MLATNNKMTTRSPTLQVVLERERMEGIGRCVCLFREGRAGLDTAACEAAYQAAIPFEWAGLNSITGQWLPIV